MTFESLFTNYLYDVDFGMTDITLPYLSEYRITIVKFLKLDI